MDKLPSQSLSKPLLLATPLFVIVLAILNSSDQLSYLFVLKFITNVGSKADITFIPTMQPQTHDENLNNDLILEQNGFKPAQLENQFGTGQAASLPLVNITQIQQWANKQPLVRGIAPRWLIPAMSQNTDILLLFSKIQHQQQIGLSNEAKILPLMSNQVAISSEIKTALGVKPGDKITIKFKLSNLLQGTKLIQKNQQHSSAQQYVPQKQNQFNPDKIAQQLAKSFDFSQYGIKQEDLARVIRNMYNDQLKFQYTIAQDFYPQGMYPSVLHNVVLFNYQQIQKVIADFVIEEIKTGILDQIIPKQFQVFWKSIRNTKVLEKQIIQNVKQFTNQFCLMSAVTLYKRQQIYHPDDPLRSQFSQLIQSSPTDVEVIAIYPIFHDSLFIKFFFQSIMQIFTFVSCLLFYYTMSLVLKQLYQQKQIEVGLWRTLGAGGVRDLDSYKNANKQLDQISDFQKSSKKKSFYRRPKFMKIKQKLFYAWQILVKVGYLYYWFLSSVVSIILYVGIKYFLFGQICKVLHFQPIAQSLWSPIIIFFSVFLFVQGLAVHHIRQIYNNPLVQTIKPVKRTFDLVKIRLIDLSTFGISSDTMLIAVMLVYYGVTAYYMIPFAVLDNNNNLQIILFNSIFIFMIFGAVLLVSVLQSRFQIMILSLIFKLSSKFRKLKLIMLKNIKAKQYKNIKVSVIISLIFAFLLFFSSGIKIQIRIIQSFVQRALGADLVLQNYQKNTFDTAKVDAYLKSKGFTYAWLSKNINRQGVQLSLQSPTIKKNSKPGFKTISSNYLDSTFQQYYVPQLYYDALNFTSLYDVLPDGLRNGFHGIQTKDGYSIGKFASNDTYLNTDPYSLNILYSQGVVKQRIPLAPEQQIINLVVSKRTQDDLGQKLGSIYKLIAQYNGKKYQMRARIVHTFKAGPGFDFLGRQCFVSTQQAEYLYQIIGANSQKINHKQKLWVKSSGPNSLNGVGQAIVAMSPQHTQLFDMTFVNQSFSLLTHYLDLYVILITAVMSMLTIIFLSIYTVGKCRDEAQMFKMLRAVGLDVKNIRHMIFLEVLIRLAVAIFDGIILGIVFSIGFSKQIEQFLMIHTPPMNVTTILIIAAVLLVVFAVAVSLSTRYLSKRTVLQTNKV